MTVELRLLGGLLDLTNAGFNLALDECGSCITASRGLPGRVEGKLIDRMIKT